MNAQDKVMYEGRKATIVAVHTDGSIALLMGDTGRMKQIKAKDAAKVSIRWTAGTY